VKHVLVLGSGFSHAVSAHMPMTDTLAGLVMDRLRADGIAAPHGPFTSSGFEAWLSRLAEPQPDLDDAENWENRALFLRVSRGLRHVMLECQKDAFKNAPPWWLRCLVGALHYSDSTVLTFNYDVLIEATVDAVGLFDEHSRRVSAGDIVRNMPSLVHAPTGSGGIRFEPGSARSFRYIKLHGSLDTFWVDGDAAGETIARWAIAGQWQQPVIESDEQRRQALPGRDPFLVPPTATKSAFYGNPLSRQLWQDAAKALREADEVALLGYSIPLTDMVTSGMLGDALRGTAARVTVVNPSPDDVRHRLIDLGIDAGRIESIPGADACAEYAARFEGSFKPAVAASVPGADLPLAVGVPGAAYTVRRLIEVTNDGVAVLEAGDAWRNTTYARSSSTWLSLQDIHAVRSVTAAKVVWPNGDESFVTRAEASPGESGTNEFLLLRVTAMPPRDH